MKTTLASLFGHGAVTVVAAPALVDDDLFPEERAYIRDAVPRRRAEFGTARVCARRGLAELGFPPLALVPKFDRSPIWPAGVVGSITHTHDLCAVVVARSPPVRSVGVDVEKLRHIERSVVDMFVTPDERRWIHEHGQCRDDLGLLFFSAKEAFYKCQYPISTTYLNFFDVEIHVDTIQRRFEARAVRAGLPDCVTRLEGKYAFQNGMVFCGVELPA